VLEHEPGQQVTPHGIDRGLTVDEVAAEHTDLVVDM